MSYHSSVRGQTLSGYALLTRRPIRTPIPGAVIEPSSWHLGNYESDAQGVFAPASVVDGNMQRLGALGAIYGVL